MYKSGNRINLDFTSNCNLARKFKFGHAQTYAYWSTMFAIISRVTSTVLIFCVTVMLKVSKFCEDIIRKEDTLFLVLSALRAHIKSLNAPKQDQRKKILAVNCYFSFF